MFTTISIQGLFLGADESPSIGVLFAQPNSALVNGGDVQGTDYISAAIDSLGRLVNASGKALVVTVTDDASTTPVGASYTFTLKLSGQGLVEFESPVSHLLAGYSDVKATTVTASPVVKLVNAIAVATMVGSAVTGTNIPVATTVISVDTAANTVTLSNNATTTGTDGTLKFASGVIDLATLQANAL